MAAQKTKYKTITKKQYCLLLFLLGLILVHPLFNHQFIPGHDYVFHMSRISAIAEALKHGVFPVRIYVDDVQFWGSPTGIFYPSLFVYIPALLLLTGVPIEICYNIFIIIIIYLGLFASMYGFTMLTHSKHAGFFASILYISSGYYLANAFIRNSLGELLALSFMPFAIACIIKFLYKAKVSLKTYALGILAISAIIESHILSSVFLVVFFCLYLAFNYKRLFLIKWKRIACISFFVFLLNASFIIPFFIFCWEIPTIITLAADNISKFIRNTFPLSIQILFLSFWNFWILISVFMFRIIQAPDSRIPSCCKFKLRIKDYIKKYNLFCASGIAIFLFSSSLFPWNFCSPLIKILCFMQFPWRLWGIATLLFCICNGIFVHLLLQPSRIKNAKIFSILFAFIICFTQVTAINSFAPNLHWKVKESTYWTRIPDLCDFDYLYKDINIATLMQQNNQYRTNAVINDYDKELTTVKFSYRTNSDTTIILPLVNYPGYVAKTEFGQQLKILESENHMLVLPLPKGNGMISVYYEGLPIFKTADYISLFSVTVFLLCIICLHRKKDWNKLKY